MSRRHYDFFPSSEDTQQQQEQDRDFHRAEYDLERLLVKVETGMAVSEDVDEIRTIMRMMGINVNAKKPKEANRGYQDE